MDFFSEAFGGFDPISDKDAAMKFCLNAVLMDRRFVDLDRLLPDVSNVGDIEGEPGWIIERRNEGDTLGYDGWPQPSRFRAFVEPDSYELAFPEFFYDRSAFISLVSSAVRAYCDRHPERGDVASILKRLS